MKTPEEVLESRGYPIDDVPKPNDVFAAVVEHGGVAHLSGVVPIAGGHVVSRGKVPSSVSVDDAVAAAELCAANLLRIFARDVGPLSRIRRVIKVTGYVNCDADFTDAHLVVHGASRLLLDVLGEAGRHARAALGMAGLPLGASVEVEMIVAFE